MKRFVAGALPAAINGSIQFRTLERGLIASF